MRIAFWIIKATCIPTICNIYFFPLQQWLHERAALLRYSTLSVLLRCKFVAIIERLPDL